MLTMENGTTSPRPAKRSRAEMEAEDDTSNGKSHQDAEGMRQALRTVA